MQIDYALILSAGLGTRMGEIGKIIPKVMWPILNKKLIDLQIDYCKELGIKKIFINTHFLANVIEAHIRDNYAGEVVLLHEDPLLDSGGAIHNLAALPEVNYQGNLLTVNGDQFLFFESSEMKRALNLLADARAVLFGIEVDKNENYNETKISDERLVDIVKNDKTKNYITFSGLGLIKLNDLRKISGPTKFFQTVANYKEEVVKMIVPRNIEYWDFGTAEIYYRSIKEMQKNLTNNQSMFIHFLKNHQVKLENISDYINPDLQSINLEGQKNFEYGSIIGCGKIQKIF